MLYYRFPRFQPIVYLLISSALLTPDTHMLPYDSSYNQWSSAMGCRSHSRNEVEFCTTAVGLWFAPEHCPAERHNYSPQRVWQQLMFAKVVGYPSNIVHWLPVRAWWRKTPIFTARRNARIASAVLAIAIPSVCPSVRPSVRHMPVLCQNDGP